MFSRFLEAGYTVYYWRVMVHLIKLATAMHEAVEGHYLRFVQISAVYFESCVSLP